MIKFRSKSGLLGARKENQIVNPEIVVGMPSQRYQQILIGGATEHGLPEAYVAKLRDMLSAYVPVASDLMGDVLPARGDEAFRQMRIGDRLLSGPNNRFKRGSDQVEALAR